MQQSAALRRVNVGCGFLYLPYYVPITTITEQLERDGAKVIKTVQEKDKETGLMTNIWNLSTEVDNPEQVQDRMRWSFEGMTGSMLMNMNGRPPKCLRCAERGHRKFECAARCRKVGHAESDSCPTQSYAARMRRREPADEIVMDEPEDVDDTTADDQPASSQSWAEQMEQMNEAAPAEGEPEASSEIKPSTPTPEEPTAKHAVQSATDKTKDKAQTTDDTQDGEGPWTVQENRKRRGCGSPSRRDGKMMAAAT